jgi:glycosyltransferase involved in cell wall biosynthesis
MGSQNTAVSVVVATRDRPQQLRACLESIRRNRVQPIEIVVVDSVCRDAHAVASIARDAQARLVRTDLPGAGHARNLGASRARGEVIAFTDDDALVDADWVQALAETFADPSVDVAVGPVFVAGSHPRAAMPVRSIDPARDAVRFSRQDRRWFDRVAFGAIGFGANLAARRSAFQRFGPFRKGLGRGAPIAGDENYFLFTTVANGGVVASQPFARVTHPAQSELRARELRRCSVAYLAYLAATQPRVAPRMALRLLRRLLPAGASGASPAARPGRWPARDIAENLLAAPALLCSAWRFERRAAAVSSRRA